MEETDKLKEAFREEARELLTELETSLLDLEKSPQDAELIGGVFRSLHTIKGSSAMFGFDNIASFIHELESAFDLVRKNKVSANKELVDLTLGARDTICAMVNAVQGVEEVDATRAAEITLALQQFLNGADEPKEQIGKPAPVRASGDIQDQPAAKRELEYSIYRIRFRPPLNALQSFANPLGLLHDLRQLGDCLAMAQVDLLPALEEIDPKNCYTYWDIVLTTNRGINAVKDIFIFVEADSELKIEMIDDSEKARHETSYKRLGEILVERGDLAREQLENVLGSQKKIGELLVATHLVSGNQVQSALAEQQQVRETRQKRQVMESAASVRVPSDKLDRLVDLVGELVTVQALLSQAATSHSDTKLHTIAEEVERLTEELRNNTMSIRMLPIGTTFNKLSRLVRDLSNELGKEVEMTTEGADTELDKTVIERLNDPLVHLIRNCISHGIEAPGERIRKGKPPQGRIHLSAVHSGGQVIVQVRDDGAGLDRAAIQARAVERGILAPDTELTEKELFALIFRQGLTTAASITSVSGRGVGMDVVKNAVEALRGSIEVSSSGGEGTSITLKLPLTLAIIDGLLVKLGAQHFIFPLAAVEECLEMSHELAENFHGRQFLNVRERVVPYIHLRDFFMIPGEPPPIEQVVITEVDGYMIGFVVDHVIGEHQTVIKALGRVYKNARGLSGATILGDGTLALIVDIPTLAYSVERRELNATYN